MPAARPLRARRLKRTVKIIRFFFFFFSAKSTGKPRLRNVTGRLSLLRVIPRPFNFMLDTLARAYVRRMCAACAQTGAIAARLTRRE